MTEPAVQGISGTGLPYPESTDPLQQGANAIKALALALDSRVVSGRGRVVRATFTGGRPPALSIASLGLKTFGGAVLTPEWDASGQVSAVPVFMAVETTGSLTTLSVVAYVFMPASTWYAGLLTYNWMVWGTV